MIRCAAACFAFMQPPICLCRRRYLTLSLIHICLDLIRKSGRILRDTPEHLIYRAILQTMYRNKIQDIQETLRKCGCRELNLKE